MSLKRESSLSPCCLTIGSLCPDEFVVIIVFFFFFFALLLFLERLQSRYHLFEVSTKNLLTYSHSTKKYRWEEKGKDRKTKQNNEIVDPLHFIQGSPASSYKMISEPNVTEV